MRILCKLRHDKISEKTTSHDIKNFPFDKFTQPTKKVFARATNFSSVCRPFIHPENILFGLMTENHGNAHKILEDLGLQKDDLTSLFKQTGTSLSNVEIGLTEQVGEIIFSAHAEALRFKQPYIETEHLLAGIFKIGQNEAKRFLENNDVTFEQVDTCITALVNHHHGYQNNF